MDKTKNIIVLILAAIGGFISKICGGWNSALTTLIIFMAIDYATGCIVAAVFHTSRKTDSGALESKVGWMGLCRKGMSLLIVLVAARIDLVMHTTFCEDAVIIGFITNEAVSILENAGLMGVRYPAAIRRALDVLNKTADEHGEDRQPPDPKSTDE